MIAIVAGVESCFGGDVDEPAVAVIAKEHARWSVARIVVRRRRACLVLTGAEEIGVHAHVQIQKTVPVVVGHRDRRQDALKRLGEPEGIRRERETPLAVVDEEQQASRRRDDQVLIAVVVDVGEERLCRVVENGDARVGRDVLEGGVAAIAVQTVGQSGRLRDVQIVEAISVGIADRDAVMTVRVTREDRVEGRHPRVEIDGELTAERVDAAQRRVGDLGEDRPPRAADQMRRGRPANDLPTRGAAPPSHVPLADVLDAIGLSSRRRRCRSARSCGGSTADRPNPPVRLT